MDANNNDRLLSLPFLVLAAIDLLYFSAAGILIAATPVFAHNRLLTDEAGVGLAMGAFSVATIVLRPLAGRWSDVRGRRLLILAGCAGFAVVTLGHLLVTSLLALVLVRLLLGACEALVFVAGVAALADIAPAGRMGEALSRTRSLCTAGWPWARCSASCCCRHGAMPPPGSWRRHCPACRRQ